MITKELLFQFWAFGLENEIGIQSVSCSWNVRYSICFLHSKTKILLYLTFKGLRREQIFIFKTYDDNDFPLYILKAKSNFTAYIYTVYEEIVSHFSFGNMGIILRFSCHALKQIIDKKFQKLSEIRLSELTKVYYCFNSKGDNFSLKQL